jgi:hypothetical protein
MPAPVDEIFAEEGMVFAGRSGVFFGWLFV